MTDTPIVSNDPAIEPESTPVSGSIWTLFFGLGLLMIGNGLNGAVIGIRTTSEGFGATTTGLVMAGFFAGFLLAPSLVISAISSVGHIRVFAGLASTASSAVLVHAVSVVPISWIVMRFVFGFCFAGLYIVIESWLNELSDASNRGKTLALYMAVSMGGLGLGQVLIAVADPSGFRLFVLSSVLVSLSLVPITLAGTTRTPPVRTPDSVAIRELVAEVPTGVVGSFMSGAATGVLLGLGAVYATRVGMSIERTALFLIAPTFGGVLMQFPVGWLSDRLRRRVMIFAVATGGAGLAFIGALVDPSSPWMIAVIFGIGGCLYPLYSLVISYTMDWMGASKTTGSSATLIRINGAGALAGPLVTSPIIGALGPAWFHWVIGGAFSIVVGFITYRLLFREAIARELEGAYVPFPARASQLALEAVAKPVRGTKRVARNVSTRRRGSGTT